MPTYTFRNKETGDVSEKIMKMSELDEFKKSHPELETVISTSEFVSSSITPMRKAGKDWNNLLTKIKQGSGRENTIKD